MWRIPPAILSGFLSVGQRPPERAQRAQGAALRWAGGRADRRDRAPGAPETGTQRATGRLCGPRSRRRNFGP